jgi:hypothetical protein
VENKNYLRMTEKPLGDHYTTIRSKINATEIPKRATHVALTCALSTINYNKKPDDPKKLLILSIFKINSVNQNTIRVVNFKILFYF